jgi:hypothetical protein
VVLAAVQSPLLAERKQASVLIPRLCSSILQAPHSARHVRPSNPLQSFHLSTAPQALHTIFGRHMQSPL